MFELLEPASEDKAGDEGWQNSSDEESLTSKRSRLGPPTSKGYYIKIERGLDHTHSSTSRQFAILEQGAYSEWACWKKTIRNEMFSFRI